MNAALHTLLVAVAAAMPMQTALAAQSAKTPTAPASAASHPPQASPTQSPAVKAAERSATPGQFRPEHPVVPQITVPLKRRGAPGMPPDANTGSSAAVAGGINDSAARCRAARSAQQRAACPPGLRASGSMQNTKNTP